MRFSCEREKFLTAFQTAAAVAPIRSPKSILRSIKLLVAEQRATLLATDMECAIRVEVPGIEMEVAGSVMLPVDRVGSILRESRDEKLLVETNDEGTCIRGERSEFKLQGEDPGEFPPVQEFHDEQYYEVSSRLFHELVRRTLFATDTDSSRYALGGVLLEFEPEKITAVGTDGRRLAKMEGPSTLVGEISPSESTTIVPAKSMQLMERSFVSAEGPLRLTVHANDLVVQTDQITIVSRLVEGRFPKWRDVFPKQRESRQVTIPVGPFHSAVRQAAIVVTDDSRGVDFAFGEGMLELSASAAEVGEAHVRMPISTEGEPVTVSLDPRYVSDFLKVLDAEKNIVFDIENSDSAALLTTDDGFGYVVMPMAKER